MKTVNVEEEVWKKLHMIRMELGVRTLNEVIKYLLDKYEGEEK